MRAFSGRLSFLRLASFLCALWGTTLFAQDRAAQERRREQWQKVDVIFAEMGVRPGAVVADVGAGDGFFTSRLAKAVGPSGRVFAVDIDDASIARLRKRLQDEGIDNVTIVKGTVDDPKLPKGTLDAALIVNAYHEMEQHQAILAGLRLALKPDSGRLVIVEPITPSRRNRPRAEETKSHEIDPEYVLQDARAAGFAVLTLKDPFTRRDGEIEWLLALQPGDLPPPRGTAIADQADAEALKDPALRISIEELVRLTQAAGVTIVDVRSSDSFAAGHIPGAMSIPLATIEASVEQLRMLGNPVVTYCS
jgi:predicted methyltransferase